MKGQSSIGSHRHVVSLANPGTATPDGDGGYVQTPVPLDPSEWHCSILPATAQDLERQAASTVASTATHILTGRYHAGITTQTTVMFKTRRFSVTGVSNPEERNIETVVLAVEMVA
jgi:head-tail adaptor